MNPWTGRRIPAALLAATLGCVVATLPPPPMEPARNAEAQATDKPEVETADTGEQASPSDAPSLEALREDRNGWVDYRLLTKDDFQAKTSYVLWGNVLHGAEICNQVFPVREDDLSELHAMMHPSCSFWNHNRKVIKKMTSVAAAAAGVLLLGDTLPDWYILQHEQLHFAIAEVAARRYSRGLAKLEPERRDKVALRLYELTLKQIKERNAELDGDTSGTFAPRALEKWVRILDSELKELCGKGPACKVRTKDPQAQ